MLNKSAASVFLALIMAPSVSAAWTNGLATYDFDSSKQACVASTEIKRNAVLTLVFPKDKKSLPIVRVTEKFSNFLNGRKYVGVRFFDRASGLKVHGFPVESGRNQYYYMVPTSAANFNAFMNYIRAKGSLDMNKLFDDKGTVKSNLVKFSLSGSTAATNAIKRCLGSQSLLSSSQSRLINVLAKYKNDAVAGNPGTNLNSINRRGSNMINSLRRIMLEGDRLQPLESELSALENNERYIELKKSYETNSTIFANEKKIVDQLTDNQNFYNNADSIIEGLEKEISRLTSLISSLDNERTQIASRLSVIEQEIDNQQVGVERDRRILDSRSLELSNARSILSQVNRDISDASVELGSKEQQLRNLQLEVRPLRQNLRVAEQRYNDRDRLKREARRRLTERYGNANQLKNDITDAQAKLEQAKLAKRVNIQIKNTIGTIQNKAREIEGVDAQIKSTTTKISCLEKLIADGGDQTSGRACDVRIRGTLAETVERIKGRKSQLESQRGNELSALESSISGISTPRNGQRIIQAINSLKSCDKNDIKDCRLKARAVGALADNRISNNDKEIAEKEKAAKEATAKLAALEKGLRDNVRGLDEKLRAEVRAASRALDANDLVIGQTIDRVDFLERELDGLERSQARLSRAVTSSQIAFNDAQNIYGDTLARLEEYKRSVGYQQILNRQSDVIRQLSSNKTSLNSSSRSLSANRVRKQKIAAEIDTYPARITDATEKRDAADLVLNDIGPEYNELAEDVSRVRSAYNRLVSILKPELISYQAEFKTVIKNLF